jgi:hypothetical protein
MNRAFLNSVGVWLLLTDGSALVYFLEDGGWGWLSRSQVSFLLLLTLLPLASAILLRASVKFLKSVQASTLYGLALGFMLPAFGGALLFAFTRGFESPAILAGALVTSVPNAIGGALAGWIQGKSELGAKGGRELR